MSTPDVSKLANEIACLIHGSDLSLDEARSAVDTKIAPLLASLAAAKETLERELNRDRRLRGLLYAFTQDLERYE